MGPWGSLSSPLPVLSISQPSQGAGQEGWGCDWKSLPTAEVGRGFTALHCKQQLPTPRPCLPSLSSPRLLLSHSHYTFHAHPEHGCSCLPCSSWEPTSARVMYPGSISTSGCKSTSLSFSEIIFLLFISNTSPAPISPHSHFLFTWG